MTAQHFIVTFLACCLSNCLFSAIVDQNTKEALKLSFYQGIPVAIMYIMWRWPG